MRIRAVTLDCAGTMVEARWNPPEFVVRCALAVGIDLEPGPAAGAYGRLLGARLPEYREVNSKRDGAANKRFWADLAVTWCKELGIAPDLVPKITEEGDRRLFGEASDVFSLYPDTLPALQALRGLEMRIAVISNWDCTLHRVLAMFGIDAFLEFALASLEEGVEKPDALLFKIALDRLGLEPGEVLHVGDDPVDDFEGARSVGMRAALIDRHQPAPSTTIIRALTSIPEVLSSIG